MSGFNKQIFNGPQGESRTRTILLKKFLVFEGSADIEGRDFSVEIIQNSIEEQRKTRKTVNVLGIVQSKFFEGKNQVKIAADYVTDMEGARTDFFALIHTTDEDLMDHTYFFTAHQIKKNFIFRTEKDGKDYYIFKLAKNRTYDSFKDIPDHEINNVIESEILRTKEYRNQEFIQSILSETLPDPLVQELYNKDFFKSLSGKHIVDKLYIGLNYFNDFKVMLAWRVIEKIRFRHSINENTYYHDFKLVTDDKEIVNFFAAIEISEKVKIKSQKFFKGVVDKQRKVDSIISRLRECNIHTIEFRINKAVDLPISSHSNTLCDCPSCTYERLNFFKIRSLATTSNKKSSSWDLLSKAWIYFALGKYKESIPLIKEAITNASDNKEPVPEFIAKYNLEILYRYTATYDSINLSNEILKLKINGEKKAMLNSIAERTLLNGFKSTIDEKYLKVKEFKERANNNSTLNLINSMRVSLIECRDFYMKNRFFITNEFHILFDKYIESCILSYSMRIEYRKHLTYFDEFEIKLMLNYGESDKLLAALQRNNIKSVKYRPHYKPFFTECVNNFFSTENIAFLKSEVVLNNGRTENMDLRRQVLKIFTNLCIILAYIEVEKIDGLLKLILNFITELDFRLDELSMLAHPILKESANFSQQDLLELAYLIKERNDTQSYLMTNCLWGLKGSGFYFNETHNTLLEYVMETAVAQPDFHLLRPLSSICNNGDVVRIKSLITNKLQTEFTIDLFYESVINDLLIDAEKYIPIYIEVLSPIIQKPDIRFMDNWNAITGLNNYKQEKLNELTDIVFTIGAANFEKDFMEEIISIHPYYDFLFNPINFDFSNFDVNWLLVNESEIVLNKIANQDLLKEELREQVKASFNKRLLKLYAQYF